MGCFEMHCLLTFSFCFFILLYLLSLAGYGYDNVCAECTLLTVKQPSGITRRTIHDAVKAGDVKELESMVKDGASVNELDASKDHFTPVHWACYMGSLEVGLFATLQIPKCCLAFRTVGKK